MAPHSANPYPRLPRGALADLRAIARALYRVWKLAGVTAERLVELEAVGKELQEVQKLARLHPDTLGHRAGWGRAERAAARLGELIAEQDAAALVEATAADVRRGRGTR